MRYGVLVDLRLEEINGRVAGEERVGPYLCYSSALPVCDLPYFKSSSFLHRMSDPTFDSSPLHFTGQHLLRRFLTITITTAHQLTNIEMVVLYRTRLLNTTCMNRFKMCTSSHHRGVLFHE